MARKSKSQYLLEKSIQAAISAIEVYNKPDFKYREESFCILIVNAWELLLKANILQKNKNQMKVLFIKDWKKTGGNKKNHYKKSRSGNFMTVEILNALNFLDIDERLKENIKLLVEIRDNAIHFYNDRKLFAKKILEIGTATLKSYVVSVKEWFDYDLSNYNFFLMPISFFHAHEMESFSINKEDKQRQNLINYIVSKEKEYPSDENKNHNISLVLETKFVRSKSSEALPMILDPNNPNALSVKIDAEDKFTDKYRWSFDDLKREFKKKYPNEKFDKQFFQIKNNIENNENFCGVRYLDPKKKKGTKKKFYSPNVLSEFDKHYNKVPISIDIVKEVKTSTEVNLFSALTDW